MSLTRLGHGLAAGAAGVTALNAITYLDMAFRAQPSSDSSSQAVEQLAGRPERGYQGRAKTAVTAWPDSGR